MKFKDSPTKHVFTCKHVVHGGEQIRYVAHDHDGDWQFMCGANSHSPSESMLISLEQAIELDASLNDLYEMPLGVGAWREAKGEPWKVFRVE
ncbi:hypothetical protein [Sanyastnella coralliicola]|uniref:hypothetical protein n=1 Tax=Sanyastnella coralliicola TaxID=3069118 RepID=UPI0027B8CDA8|nr:hypothetical protein [Longitalea sp. SCSIO 12813]